MMDNKDIDKIKLIVDLTLAKVEILKLKGDNYAWQCHTDKKAREQLLEALEDIDELLATLKIKEGE